MYLSDTFIVQPEEATMSTFLKLMFVPIVITVLGLVGLLQHQVAASPMALVLILIVLFCTGAAFAALEAHKETSADV